MKKDIIKKVIIGVLGVIVIVALVFGFSLAKDMFGLKKSRELIVSIPEGAGIREISEILEENGIVEYSQVFRLRASLGNYVIQQGRHVLDRSMSYGKLLKKLTSIPDAGYDDIYKVLIPEGYEIKDIAKVLSEKGLIDEKVFFEEIENGDFDYPFINEIKRDENRLEGYLFPATYEIQKGESEHTIINKMLEAFNMFVVPLYENSGTNLSLDEIVTMASIVEREAANDSERPLVSSVFYNRLKKDMTLSSCATVQYILKERKKILSVADTKIKSPYNTYKEKGLPPGPIASPGKASIEAALSPADTDYLYFAAKSDGSSNVFSRTDEEHLKTVKMLQN